MTRMTLGLGIVVEMALTCATYLPTALAQQPTAAETTAPATSRTNTVVPKLVNYNGILEDLNRRPASGLTGVTFLLYKDSQGGAPLWMETQNVRPDKTGHYSVMLGSTTSQGLPADLFVSGEARWLAVQPQGQAEQPRVLLVAVPYAMKAADAETVGGLPASAFVLAGTTSGAQATSTESDAAGNTPAALPPAAITGSGTASFLPLFTGTATLGNSAVFQSGASPTSKIGINTSTPSTTLDVKGSGTFRGALALPATSPATAAGGKASQPLNLIASSFNSVTGTPVNQLFRWQSEPVGNNTAATGGTLNLLYASGANAAAETGLKIGSNGRITFAAGQIFPGTGTVTSVAAGLGLKGGPITNSGTLSINPAVVPQLTTVNTFTKSQAVTITNGTTALSLSNTGNSPVLVVNNTGGEDGIDVFANGGAAVFGSNPEGTGVFGISQSAAGAVFGVVGENRNSPDGAGVYGLISESSSAMGHIWNSDGAGVWGDGGDGGHYGVIGTADTHAAGIFENNSDNDYALYVANNNVLGYPFAAFNGAGKGCSIDPGGNLNCTGAKHAVVPLDGGRRQVALSAIESPRNWFEDFGSEQLSHGAAVVNLEPDFRQTVNTAVEYHVFLTPKGDCKGLYVANETPSSFEVRELGGGISAVRFDYRIVALRKDYENIRLADHTRDLGPMKFPARKTPLNLDINRRHAHPAPKGN